MKSVPRYIGFSGEVKFRGSCICTCDCAATSVREAVAGTISIVETEGDAEAPKLFNTR